MRGNEKDKKAKLGQELMATLNYIKNLHGECDWLLKYADARREARNGDIDSLTKARAVLSRADYQCRLSRVRQKMKQHNCRTFTPVTMSNVKNETAQFSR